MLLTCCKMNQKVGTRLILSDAFDELTNRSVVVDEP